MSTAIIGAVFVDVKGFSFGPYDPIGTNIGSVSIVPGGVARNVCEDFAMQGEKAVFYSMVDETPMGNGFRVELDRKGVDVSNTLVCKDGMGMWLAILDDSGNLVGSVSKQPDFTRLEAFLRDHGERLLADADNVVLEIDMNDGIASQVLDICERLHKDVYSIVGNMSVILKHMEYLRRVRCYICNEIEASRLFGENVQSFDQQAMRDYIIAHAPALGLRQMIVTMGAKGSVYCDLETGENGFCPSIQTDMVDSTGAGDAFFAGTVMACTKGYRLKRAVAVGTRLASATIASPFSSCERVGGLFDA